MQSLYLVTENSICSQLTHGTVNQNAELRVCTDTVCPHFYVSAPSRFNTRAHVSHDEIVFEKAS